MHRNRQGHVPLFGSFQKTHHRIHRGVFVVMAAVAGIGLLVETSRIYGCLRKHEPEGVTVGVAGLADAGHAGHVTAHAAAKGVNAVHRTVLHCGVAAFAQPVLKQPGLGADNHQRVWHLSNGLQRTTTSVYVVAGDAGHTYFSMCYRFSKPFRRSFNSNLQRRRSI